MIQKLKAFERTFTTLVKAFFVLLMFAIFYGFFLFDGAELRTELLRVSRVSAILTMTFLVLHFSMIRIYGGYSIGGKGIKETILSMIVAVSITDIISFLQLCVMEKRIVNIAILILVMVMQFLAIWIITYFANIVYYKINPPKKLLIVYGDAIKLNNILLKLRRYKKRFKVGKVMHFSAEELHRSIRASEAVMLIDVPSSKKDYIIEYCYKREKQIYYTPELADILINNAGHELVEDTTMFSYEHRGLTPLQKVLKRLCDIVISGIGLIICTPIMIAQAIAIKLEDGGPVLFKQERSTINGKLFKVWKFRTMVVHAEKSGTAVLASKNDPRITKVGAFLRKTRMDELPQLFNVFFGSMSIVGPRPERDSIAQQYYKDLPEFEYRLKVKAGLTGYAQILGKYNTTPKDKLVLDLLYIEDYSLRLDFKIMFQTAIVFLTPERTEGFKETERTSFKKQKNSKD
ncbi:MAG: sugar transferase [Clostridiales bacterium]|nr:sugar transferase [Clostridiales bacterium]